MNASNTTHERRSTLSTASGPSGEKPPVFAFGSNKIENRHLEELAFVYVRQSDPQQVRRHRESTDLQYQLVRLAMQLGWSEDRIVVIDEDLGITAKHIEGRAGFQRLMTEVGLDHAGIIIGIEMSRLARSCKDWYQLLDLCALFGTVLADPDGVYYYSAGFKSTGHIEETANEHESALIGEQEGFTGYQILNFIRESTRCIRVERTFHRGAPVISVH